MSLNKIMIIGNVGQDPQIRTVGESKVANFSVATTEKYKGKDGNVVSETEWHSVAVWGKLAEVVEKYVRKGTSVYVEGRVKSELYTDKNGNEKVIYRIIASGLQLLGGKPEAQSAGSPAPAPQTPAPQQKFKTTPLPTVDEAPDDDLPF
jgi:single-strand DNA-binding protein